MNMSKIVLIFFLSLLFFATLEYNGDAKVEAKIVPTIQYARKPVSRLRKYYFYKYYSEYLVSPNKQYTIVWSPGNINNSIRRNYLYDISADKLITSVRYCKAYSNQNSSSISTIWRADSQVVLITYDGKLAPRDACLVSVDGAQFNVYNQLKKDVMTYLEKSGDINYFNNKNRVVVDFFKTESLLKLSLHRLTMLVTLYVPKSGGYSQSFLVNYRYQVIGNYIEFNLVDIQRI
jgi:hypothetical protein